MVLLIHQPLLRSFARTLYCDVSSCVTNTSATFLIFLSCVD